MLVPTGGNGARPNSSTCFFIPPTVQVVLGVGGGSLLLEWPQQQEPALQDLTVSGGGGGCGRHMITSYNKQVHQVAETAEAVTQDHTVGGFWGA